MCTGLLRVLSSVYRATEGGIKCVQGYWDRSRRGGSHGSGGLKYVTRTHGAGRTVRGGWDLGSSHQVVGSDRVGQFLM